jgi:hypothetical protein
MFLLLPPHLYLVYTILSDTIPLFYTSTEKGIAALTTFHHDTSLIVEDMGKEYGGTAIRRRLNISAWEF